jgi:aspartokinase-like uncharacterized kinase
MTVWVVKIGGSLANSEELPRWLDVIATAGAGKVVLVPGGGPWADEVRAAQKREGFDDSVAHRKALRAIEQYGKVLAGMRTNLVPAAGIAEIHEVLRNRQIAVWMPHEMVVADPSIPESWDVTSDSLAAWLTGRLRAQGLVLVKSVEFGGGVVVDATELVERGWVDACFPRFVAAAGCAVHAMSRDGYERFGRMLRLGFGVIAGS